GRQAPARAVHVHPAADRGRRRIRAEPLMDTILDTTTLLGGIAFDPHIRSILVVLTGVVILAGSIWLIIATNLGTRLGFLLTAGGLFGWMTIIGITWWLTPPAIGPRGDTPK